MTIARQIEFANVSDAGRKRPHNEDSAVTDLNLGLALVADGMGGYKAGEVASAIAAKVVLEGIRTGIDRHRFVRKHVDGERSKESLLMQESILEANQHIYRTARDVPQCQGMGTTIVAILFTDTKVVVAHVGDSRVYRFRNGQLAQLTSDHSLIQELIDRGFFTPEEAHANTPKNLVTRALGIDDNVVVDVQELDALANDIYLLCSDGLNDMVDDEEIRLTLSKYSANLAKAAHELVRLANESGGKDNISVVLARPLQQATGGSGILAKLMRLLTRST